MAIPLSDAAKQAIARIVSTSNADILLFHAPIKRHLDRRMIKACHMATRRPNLILLLVTEGGDPDAAYRISRSLQNRYEKFSCLISGFCKSAGTLILLGAQELIFSEHGEIGPLDIQLAKKDALWESESGLTVMTALGALHENAREAFDEFFLSVSRKSGGRITVRTASEIAVKLTEALYSPIAQQMDPIHIGEVYRSMAIAREYGTRLMAKSQNFDTDTLNELISSYPSHGFVIDEEEAAEKFNNVRSCTEDERILIDELGNIASVPSGASLIEYISESAIIGEAHADRTPSTPVLEQAGDAGATPQAAGEDFQANGQAKPASAM